MLSLFPDTTLRYCQSERYRCRKRVSARGAGRPSRRQTRRRM